MEENKYYFYTIMANGKFLNFNLMKEDSENINDAIKFFDESNAKYFMEDLNKNLGYKLVRVTYILEEA